MVVNPQTTYCLSVCLFFVAKHYESCLINLFGSIINDNLIMNWKLGNRVNIYAHIIYCSLQVI